MYLKNKTKNSGWFSVFCFLIGLYVFGYGVTSRETSFTDKGDLNDKNYSISFSLANGSKPGLTVFFSLGLVSLLYLLYTKFIVKDRIYIILNLLAITAYSLLVSMIYYSFLENQGLSNDRKEEHLYVASLAFILVLIFNITIAYTTLYKKYKNIFWIFVIINISFFLSLVADTEYASYIKKNDRGKKKNYKDTYFPIGENINYNFFMASILIATFVPLNYRTKEYIKETKL